VKALPPDFDASIPLRDDRYERFSQLRVIGVPCQSAANEAGFRSRGTKTSPGDKPILPGNAARLDRHPEVIARKGYLASDDAEVIAATRLFVRDRLMKSATLDVLDQFAIVGTVEIEGKKVPRIIGIDWEELKASDQSIAITGFKFDRETGMMTEFTRDDPQAALAQIRDMYGLRAPRRTELTGRGGGPVQTLDVSKYTDEELIQLESILAAAATRSGVDVGASGDRAEDSAPAIEPAAERNVVIPSNGR
jgi:hypothetical protein